MEYIWFIAGVVAGVIATIIVYSIQTKHGTLRIDRSNPERDVFRFDIDDLDILTKKRRVILNIDKNANLSQH